MTILKKAFTLTEVLITIGIIGIVAALTLPALMRLHQDAGTGPILAKVQTSMEEAVGRVLLDNPDVVLGTSTTAATLIGYLDDIFVMTNTSGDWYNLKDGASIKITSGTEGTIPASAGAPNEGYLVDVDINGPSKSPNTEGVDRFRFVLTTYGLMLPVGSKVLDQEQDGERCTETNPTIYCTGHIADNNWRIDY